MLSLTDNEISVMLFVILFTLSWVLFLGLCALMSHMADKREQRDIARTSIRR